MFDMKKLWFQQKYGRLASSLYPSVIQPGLLVNPRSKGDCRKIAEG